MSAGPAITIGTFDGVHLGHRRLVAAARQAVGAGGEVIVLAFEPHPQARLRPGAEPPVLSTWDQRVGWLLTAGADSVHRLDPTPELLSQPPERFLSELCRRHRPGYIVEGRDFRFGHRRAGDIGTLRACESSGGYATIVVDDVEAALTDGAVVRVRSSLIRWLVAHGRVRDAAVLLGRPYELAGRVVTGDRRGQAQLGVATANLDPGRGLLPADGVYCGSAPGPDGRRYPAAVSVGTKPTFGANPRICEAHLIGFEAPADEYGWVLRLAVHDWLRDQIAFDSVPRLVEQMHRDIARVLAARHVTECPAPTHA